MRLIPHGTEYLFKTGLLVMVVEHDTHAGEVQCKVITPEEKEGQDVAFRDLFLVHNAERLDDKAAKFARQFRAEQKALAVRKARGLA